jgi:hypothetical protein
MHLLYSGFVDTLRSFDWFIKKYINSDGGLRLAAWRVLVYPDVTK